MAKRVVAGYRIATDDEAKVLDAVTSGPQCHLIRDYGDRAVSCDKPQFKDGFCKEHQPYAGNPVPDISVAALISEPEAVQETTMAKKVAKKNGNGAKKSEKSFGTAFECKVHGKVKPYVCRTYRTCPECAKDRRVAYAKRKKAGKVGIWTASPDYKPKNGAKKPGKAKKAKASGNGKAVDYKARAFKAAATRKAKKAAQAVAE